MQGWMHGPDIAVKRNRQLCGARGDGDLIELEAFDVALWIEPAEAQMQEGPEQSERRGLLHHVEKKLAFIEASLRRPSLSVSIAYSLLPTNTQGVR